MPQLNLLGEPQPCDLRLTLSYDAVTDTFQVLAIAYNTEHSVTDALSGKLPYQFSDTRLGELIGDLFVDWIRTTPKHALGWFDKGMSRLDGSTAGIG